MNLAQTQITNCTAMGNAATEGGGAIANIGGTINITQNSILQNNAATGTSGSGGAILNLAGGSLNISDSEISNNTSNRAGGGIEDVSGDATTVVLSNVTFDGNATASAPGNGGAVHITGAGNMDITGGTITNNTAGAEGGGLWNGAGTMTVSGTSIMGNTASGNDSTQGGGGVFNAGGQVIINNSALVNNQTTSMGNGGGINNEATGTFELNYSTISGNQSTVSGGGISNNGTLIINAVTIANNSATVSGGGIFQTDITNSLTLKSTIVATNTTTGTGLDLSGSGMFNSAGYNLIGSDDENKLMAADSDQTGTSEQAIDPNLAALADNGGATPSHALQCPSPAINNGDPMDDNADQRGDAVFETRRDIGAFEYQQMCITDNTTGIVGDLGGSEIFPNPSTTGAIRISIPNSFGTKVKIRITSMAGSVLKQFQFDPGNYDLGLSYLQSGTYLVQAITSKGIETHKLVLLN